MNTFRTFIIGVLFILCNSANAQIENSLLWKISGNGLKAPSYLFGTIHAICPDQLKFSDKVQLSFQKTEQLVLELDMDSPKLMKDMLRLSVNENMENISNLLSKEQLNKLNNFFNKHYNVDMEKIGIQKPFALLSMVFLKGLECSHPTSYEQELVYLAQQHKWEVLGLETVEEQIAVFDKVPEKEQLEWLVKYVSDENEFRNNLAKLIKAYEEEDINKILQSMSDYPEYKGIENALLYDRNQKWISKITEYAHDKATFFAVGAAHLASDKGVIELLRKEGFTLTPILK